jgi:hypothetical protein
MVHALTQCHRVLVTQGFIADLHPERGRRPQGRRLQVFAATNRSEVPVGLLEESADFYRRYLAADRAIERVVARGLFSLQTSDVFLLRYHFSSLPALEQTLKKEWAQGYTPSGSLLRRLRALFRAQPDAQIIVEEPFRLNVLQKNTPVSSYLCAEILDLIKLRPGTLDRRSL